MASKYHLLINLYKILLLFQLFCKDFINKLVRLRSVSASLSLWLLCWTLLGHFTVFVKCCRQICFHNYFCPNFIYSTLFSSFSLISMTILSVQYMIYNASLSYSCEWRPLFSSVFLNVSAWDNMSVTSSQWRHLLAAEGRHYIKGEIGIIL